MTRAPASASRTVHMGAATACSMAMTRRSASGRVMRASIGTRQAKNMLGEVAQDEVGRDRRYLIEPGLAELALDVELLGETEAAMGLHADIGRLPSSVSREH